MRCEASGVEADLGGLDLDLDRRAHAGPPGTATSPDPRQGRGSPSQRGGGYAEAGPSLASQTVPSGGTRSSALAGWPCQPSPDASTWPPLPTPLP